MSAIVLCLAYEGFPHDLHIAEPTLLIYLCCISCLGGMVARPQPLSKVSHAQPWPKICDTKTTQEEPNHWLTKDLTVYQTSKYKCANLHRNCIVVSASVFGGLGTQLDSLVFLLPLTSSHDNQGFECEPLCDTTMSEAC
jgi:hypothetical protein